ncbi:UBX domain-containing protein 6 isoform 2-T2 [Sarcophilus harrisii]
MKKFFQEIKADIKFKSAGPGQKLTDTAGEKVPRERQSQQVTKQSRQGPTNEAQMAAAAALARLEQKQPRSRGPTSQDSIRNQVKKELQAEATVSGNAETSGANHSKKDPVAASIMKIHTFNRDREKVKLGVDTIAKYLDNIHLHPEEEKYRKIKLQNKVFQERINCLEGANEFFEAIGFEKMTLPIPEQDTSEDYYVLSKEALAEVEKLEQHKVTLQTSEPVRAQLNRQRRVFKPSPLAAQFDLPGDFFNLTAEELKREQKQRADAVERLSVLRTKAMREKEEQREMRKYTYTLLRVRFPDGHILQGTFYARERLSTLYTFVREALQDDWLPFELLPAGGHKLLDENLAFNECGLVPSALLTFTWDTGVLEDIKASGAKQSPGILKPELLATVENLA